MPETTFTLRTSLTRQILDEDVRKFRKRVLLESDDQLPPAAVTHGDGTWTDYSTRTIYLPEYSWPVGAGELAKTYFDKCLMMGNWKGGRKTPRNLLLPQTGHPAIPSPPAFSTNPGNGQFVQSDLIAAYPRIYCGLSLDAKFRYLDGVGYSLSFGEAPFIWRDDWLADPELKRARVVLYGLMHRPRGNAQDKDHNAHAAPHVVSAMFHILHAAVLDAKDAGALAWFKNDSFICRAEDFAKVRRALAGWHFECHEPVPVEHFPRERKNLLPLTQADRTGLHELWMWSDGKASEDTLQIRNLVA